jgi:hypothetical protein
MMAVFGELPGFTPSCFVAEANPPSVLAGARTWKGASRPSAQGFAAYARAVEQARGARVGWNGLSLAVARSYRFAVDGASDVLRLHVSAIADDAPSERGVHVVAHAYPGAHGGAIPLGLARAIRHSLQSRGYELFARSRGSAPETHLRVGGSKTLRSPAAAARECSAVRMGIASSINVRGYEDAGLTLR